jgi:hypothetical protein
MSYRLAVVMLGTWSWLCVSTGCTVVSDPPPEDVAADTSVVPDLPETPDLPESPPDTPPDLVEPDIAPDVAIGPADIIIGPTDVFIVPDSASDTTASDTAATDTTPTDTGPTLPPYDTPKPRRWRLVWQDDFNGPPCDPQTPGSCPDEDTRDYVTRCFGTRGSPVQTTILNTFHPDPSNPNHFRRASLSGLAQLDKCVWAISDHVNSRHFVGASGPLMSYRPEAVTVERGELRLTTRRSPNWTSGSNDCGRRIDPNGPNSEENLTRNCEYDGANVVSQPFNGIDRANDALGRASGNGRIFPRPGATEGRLEVRARMPRVNGSVPVVSTWASDSGRFEPEYTLLNHTIDAPRTTNHGVTVYGNPSGSGRARHIWNEPQVAANDEFHIHAATWKANDYVEFHMNHQFLGRFAEGARLAGGNGCTTLRVTGNPVHLMMRNILSRYDSFPTLGPAGAIQPHDTLHIDWVRWWEPCDEGDDDPACVESTLSTGCTHPCEGVGTFEGDGCFVGETPEGTTAEATERYVGYRRATGITPCPLGGMNLDGICAVVAVPPGRTGYVRGNRWYTTPVCSPTQGLANCGRPCPVAGTTWIPDKYACFYREKIPGTNPFVYDNQLYYAKVEGHADGPCPFGGNFDGANCHLGSAPGNSVAKTIDGDYYLEPDVCPFGGRWDFERKGCQIGTFPAGTNVFVYANAIYYSTPTAGQCAQGGSWDGANCRWREIPVGMEAFVHEGRPFFAAACFYSSNWAALPVYPATTSVEGTPCP